MNTYVYSLSDPVTHAVRYIGVTHNPKERRYQHLTQSSSTAVRRWVRMLKGKDLKPVFHVLEQTDEINKFTCENKWIAVYSKTVFNKAPAQPLKNTGVLSFKVV